MKKNLEVILKYTKENNGCLEWTRCLNTDGYPRALVEGNANYKVHRLVVELTRGEIPKGHVVRHSCDNPRCLNPDHLLIGTPRDNIRDRDIRQRHGQAKLSHEEVQAARLLFQNEKYSVQNLSTMFNVSITNMRSLLKYKHWKHVP